MPLLHRIELFLARHAMRETEFGRLAINDPRLVRDLRNGRTLRAKTLARVLHFLDSRR